MFPCDCGAEWMLGFIQALTNGSCTPVLTFSTEPLQEKRQKALERIKGGRLGSLNPTPPHTSPPAAPIAFRIRSHKFLEFYSSCRVAFRFRVTVVFTFLSQSAVGFRWREVVVGGLGLGRPQSLACQYSCRGFVNLTHVDPLTHLQRKILKRRLMSLSTMRSTRRNTTESDRNGWAMTTSLSMTMVTTWAIGLHLTPTH